jgi:NAD(P)-dependent dehydrogenase (short-subunit alcohol dehydrogenase family)
MSSILGFITLMADTTGWGFSPPYSFSKASLNMFTKMTANKLAQDNIVVYASHPGWCQTDMGGGAAPTIVPDSISGQLTKLDNLTLADSGKYFDYEGNDMDW